MTNRSRTRRTDPPHGTAAGATPDPEVCWRAVLARDRRFEGRFFLAVASTGIYCKPGCPARLPARRNARFFASAAAAEREGFRPCLRCRPETAPGSAAAAGTSAIVRRALRLIEAGALEEGSVESLAARVGVTSRWLRQLFQARLGAGPLAVARTRRAHLARRLIESSALTTEAIAAATGFGSSRRMRHSLREAFGRPARELRDDGAAPRRRARAREAALELLLRARGAFDPRPTFEFLGPRAIPGVEVVEPGRWRRSAAIGSGVVRIEAQATGADTLRVVIRPPLEGAVTSLATRVARVFDLEADARAIAVELRRDPWLKPRLPAAGVRIPGAWDPFEMGVRAIVGQQISVAAARTVLGRLASRFGAPLDPAGDGITHVFPSAAALARAELEGVGLTRARAASLQAFARAVAEGSLDFDAPAPLEATIARLTALPGIGDWTAHEIALRALGEPDAFPAGDLILRRALAGAGEAPAEAEVRRRAERWRPWRAYAAVSLWRSFSNSPRGARRAQRQTPRSKP
jgi:AraC family transcriptional regulator of adaptative response / DNA-3-methyladenine glycosylase II